MQEFIFGLVAFGLGLAFVFSGWRLFRILIPIWGFFGGFALGAAVSTSLFGGNFLATGIGVVLGVFLGLIFAVMSYFFFNVAVIILAATVGYWIGAGFIGLLGLSTNGFLAITLGVVVATVVALMALVGNFTKFFVIVVSSFGGATTVIAGILLMINRFTLDEFSIEATRHVIDQSWVWFLVWVVLAAVGIASQLQSTREYELEEWSYSSRNS